VRNSDATATWPTVSLVLPCYNEAKNLPAVFAAIPSFVTEVIFVDGGSKDDSIEVARSLRPDIVVLGQEAPGKGLALTIGLLAATSDIVVMADTDCSTDLDEMHLFLTALLSGADLAKGTRHLPPGGSDDFTRIRRLGNWFLVRFVNLLFRTKWTDLAYGYAAFWTDTVNAIGLAEIRDLQHSIECGESRRPQVYGHGFEIETLMFCRTAHLGYVVAEVPSHERRRVHGGSNLNAMRDGLRVLHCIFTELLTRHAPSLKVKSSVDERMARRR
jgi:glycosyltransferase involved in cell wall biosynthesis